MCVWISAPCIGGVWYNNHVNGYRYTLARKGIEEQATAVFLIPRYCYENSEGGEEAQPPSSYRFELPDRNAYWDSIALREFFFTLSLAPKGAEVAACVGVSVTMRPPGRSGAAWGRAIAAQTCECICCCAGHYTPLLRRMVDGGGREEGMYGNRDELGSG